MKQPDVVGIGVVIYISNLQYLKASSFKERNVF